MGNFGRDFVLLVARIFLAAAFIYDGFDLIHNGPTAGFAYVEKYGLPGWSWWLALALELGGGALIVFGFMTRWVSAIFILFCLMTACFFHNAFSVTTALNFTAAGTVIEFGKDIGLAGGYLLLVAVGAGKISLDHAVRRKA